jgi:hypothetical protein
VNIMSSPSTSSGGQIVIDRDALLNILYNYLAKKTHHAQHEKGGEDEIDISGWIGDGLLWDSQNRLVKVNVDNETIKINSQGQLYSVGGFDPNTLLNHWITRIKFDYGGALTDIDAKFTGGWLFVKYTGSTYPAIWYDMPIPYIGLLDSSEVLHLISIIYFHSLPNAYINFLERFRGEASSTCVGLYINSSGSISLHNAGSETSIGSISAGDTVLLDTEIYYDSNAGKWKLGGVVYKWDWSSLGFSSIGSASADLPDNYKWKYYALIEANASKLDVAIGYVFVYEDQYSLAVNGNRHYHWRWLVNKGLVKNPSTVYPW